ncbi:hypothetical protein C8F01DRAFT_1237534 [Mycena amicta]|nr:hypothetical protein C8F01DRAFT_1237534 [Mycena amicta]
MTTKSESIASDMNAALLREQKAQLEERILQTEMQLESLKAQRVLVEQELSKIVYPVLSLPSELTTKIFALAVATGVAAHDPVLLQLASVCQQWRAVALDNPGLWQFISFTNMISDAEQLSLCFTERSGTLPIHISILIRDPGDWERWQIPMGILHCSARWKTAHFLSELATSAAQPVYVPKDFSGSLVLPLLEELTMNYSINNQGEDRSMLFRDAPCLHNLCFSHPVLVPHVGLPMEQLRRLEFFDHCTPVELLELLSHTRNLETLILPSLSSGWPTAIFTGPPLPIYRKLHTLSCVLGGDSHVIDWLTAPALHTLHLQGWNGLSEAVLAFLNRSCCTIRNLSLQHGWGYETLATFMKCPALVGVSHLSLTVNSMAPEEDSNFASLLGNGTFLPSLKSLTIIVPFGSAWCIEPYIFGVINRAQLLVEPELASSAEGNREISQIDEFTLEFDVEELYDEHIENLEYLDQEFGVQVIIPNGLPSVRKWSMSA